MISSYVCNDMIPSDTKRMNPTLSHDIILQVKIVQNYDRRKTKI